MLKALFREFTNIFLPRLCAGCDKPLAFDEEYVCLGCLLRLVPVSRTDCEKVLLPVLDRLECEPGPVASWLRYRPNDVGSEIIKAIKYRRRARMGTQLGRMFARELLARPEYNDGTSPAPSSIDVLLPIPLHWTKEVRRGYNQTFRIALGIAEVLGAQVAHNLVASRPHATQTRRTHAERAENVRGIFAVEFPHELDGLNVALVDDVVTTGATMTEAVLALARSGARPASVGVLSLGLANG